MYGKPPEVQVVHGGLECGVIVSKLPGMEAISFGPLIRGAHTSEEHVYAFTVASTWRLLVALLEALCIRSYVVIPSRSDASCCKRVGLTQRGSLLI